MDYVNLATKEVFGYKGGTIRTFLGKFQNAEDLQEILKQFASEKGCTFNGFKKPRKFIAVIRRFEKETGREVLY